MIVLFPNFWLMIKRILLFGLTNIAVIAIITVVVILLERYFHIDMSNGNILGIAIISLIIGFTGAFISLLISRWSAKRTYAIILIDHTNKHQASVKEQKVYELIERLSLQNGIKIPEVGVYIDNDANAFATGRSKNASLVAVSTALLEQCSQEEIEWIVAHEMSHILNGDMVTMTLLQGVLNTFVIFLSRIVAQFLDEATDGKLGWLGYQAVYILLQILLGFGATIIAMKFSRHREYRADFGSAQFVWKKKMIAALRRLQLIHAAKVPIGTDQLSAFKISASEKISLFASHPSLESRIAALEENYQIA